MTSKPRNYQAEYTRRIANAIAKGHSRSQARGHARAGEKPSRGPPRPIEDYRLQIAFRVLRQEKNFEAAAKAARISPERLRRHAVERALIEKSGRSWRPRADLPRKLKIFSQGKSQTVIVPDMAAASLAGQYMSAVGQFLRTNDTTPLAPFIGKSVRDIAGKKYPLETNPNTLYRLSTSGEPTFEHIYRIVI